MEIWFNSAADASELPALVFNDGRHFTAPTSTSTAGYVTRVFGIPAATRERVNSFSRVLPMKVRCLRLHLWHRNLLQH